MAKRRSSLTPQFEWDEEAGEYYWLTGPNAGKKVPRILVREALDAYLENKTAYVRSLAEQLRSRVISLEDFQREIERTIPKIHLASAAAAKGGWAQLDQKDFGRIGRLVRDEFKYLRRFAVQIEKGLPLDGRFMQRIEQYAQAGRHTYHVIETALMRELGMDEERSIRHASDSCEDCLYWAARKWVKIGTSPQPGARKCRRKCKCTKIYRKRPAELFQSSREYFPAIFSVDPEMLIKEIAATGVLANAKAAFATVGRTVPVNPTTGANMIMEEILARQGFDGLPELVTDEDFATLLAERRRVLGIQEEPDTLTKMMAQGQVGALPFYRDVTLPVGFQGSEAEAIAQLHKYGEAFRSGVLFAGVQARWGSGIYFSPVPGYVGRGAKKLEIRALLRSSAKIITWELLVKEMERDGYNPSIQIGYNAGYYAASKGYDAYFVYDEAFNDFYFVVLNRTSLIVLNRDIII